MHKYSLINPFNVAFVELHPLVCRYNFKFMLNRTIQHH